MWPNVHSSRDGRVHLDGLYLVIEWVAKHALQDDVYTHGNLGLLDSDGEADDSHPLTTL